MKRAFECSRKEISGVYGIISAIIFVGKRDKMHGIGYGTVSFAFARQKHFAGAGANVHSSGNMFRLSAIAFLFFMTVCAPFVAAQAVNLDTTIRAAGAGTNTSRVADLRRWKIGPYNVEAQDKKSYVTINGTRIYTGKALSCAHGKIFIQKHDWDKHVSPIVSPSKKSVPAARKIIIDAGHGGKDPGKIQGKMREKSYTLDIAKRLQRILTKRGYTVVLVREHDVFVELEDRAKKANAVQADLFVSVHFNAAEAKSARGIETWMLTPVGEASFASKTVKKKADTGNRNDAWNLLLAYKVQSALSNKIDAEDRGVKCANFTVLRELKCPGILVECGFFTNASEAALIARTNRRELIAQGIADGISSYAAILNSLKGNKPAETHKSSSKKKSLLLRRR